ncbi:MAG TPA: translation initiation factor [Verrucomicrobiae bacterium]|nr:translation initiation factor [Verrucomicrobiae bacterium]
MSGHKRIPTDGGQSLSHNPFAALSSAGLPPAPEQPGGPSGPSRPAAVTASRSPSGEVEARRLVSSLPPPNATKPAPKNRGRVDIIRQTAGRGGKTVTVVKGFAGIGLPEKEQLARAMQRACGTGGTVKNGQIEIQGDKRAEIARILTEANFRPVFAGG